MPQDANLYLIMGVIALSAVIIVAGIVLRGWRDWIAFKRSELDQQFLDRRESGAPSAVSRIEVADLKERVKKLEAIAAGIDP